MASGTVSLVGEREDVQDIVEELFHECRSVATAHGGGVVYFRVTESMADDLLEQYNFEHKIDVARRAPVGVGVEVYAVGRREAGFYSEFAERANNVIAQGKDEGDPSPDAVAWSFAFLQEDFMVDPEVLVDWDWP